ncbi:MAG: type VI secretion system baseplate subunit TssF [Methylococcaceae bacterium]
MALKQLFRDELAYLHLQGNEFAKRNPDLSHFLSEKSSDPDVERLLEGFAFLSARLRQKIEDDFPELTHSIINLLWPNYLRPLPSTTIIQFSPKTDSITEKQIIEKNASLRSQPVDGVECQFTSCHEVSVYPLIINAIDETHSRDKSIIGINIQTLTDQPLNTIDCNQLTFYLAGNRYTAQTLYLWIFNYLTKIDIIIEDQVTQSLSSKHINAIGFDPSQALLPYPENVFDGYRILQEYLNFPQRFNFFDLVNLLPIWPNTSAKKIRLEFHFKRPFPADIKIRRNDFQLYCTPAVNLFAHDGDPISLDGKSTDYMIRPSSYDQASYEIFSIDKVTGRKQSSDKSTNPNRTYYAFESFQHEIERSHNRKALYFRNRISESRTKPGFEQTISFIREDETHYTPEQTEIISIEMTCSNRNLPEALAIGDINIATEEIPSFVTFENITQPTSPVRPVLDGSLHWKLISNCSLNYLSLLKVGPLRSIIQAYDFKANEDEQAKRHLFQRLEGIEKITTTPIDRLLKGLPIRGSSSTITINADKFHSEGELYLFGTVLSHFFSLFSTINSFHVLEVVNSTNNERYTWPLQKGIQPLI